MATYKLLQQVSEVKLTPPTQDGSFSMEIQYQYDSLVSDVMRQSVNTVIQVIHNSDIFFNLTRCSFPY